MEHLTDQQIDFIAAIVEKSKITSSEIKEDLVDHFCCATEEYMAKGRSFKDAYDLAYHNIAPDGFDEIERETIYLLTSKKISTMKKMLYISGYLSVLLATTSLIFKLFHIPGGSLAVLGTGALVEFIFLPILFIYLYRREINKSLTTRLLHILGFATLMLLGLATVTKLSHWPGTILMLSASLAVLNFALLPLFLFKRYRKAA